MCFDPREPRRRRRPIAEESHRVGGLPHGRGILSDDARLPPRREVGIERTNARGSFLASLFGKTASLLRRLVLSLSGLTREPLYLERLRGSH